MRAQGPRQHQFINSCMYLSRFCCMDHWKACHALLNKHPCASQELTHLGVARSTLSRWASTGRILRLAYGLYGLPDAAYDEHHSLVLVQGQMPNGILCLLSALQFHGITSQLPREVWMAMEGGTHQPRVTGIKVRVSRFTGEAYSSGIETHQVEGGSLRVYGVTKTVIDCFRMRNKIGVDIAIEALRDALRSRKTTIGELESTAARLRARTILRPYLEMAAAS